MNRKPDQPGLEPLLARPYTAGEIPVKGVNGLVEASEKERAQIAAALDLAALENFKMNFQLSRAGRGRFKLSGHLLASVTQICVVSLSPVNTRVDETIEAEFWPAEEVERIEADEEPESMFVPYDGPEPIMDGIIDIGQLAYEHLAASLDPYPKDAGAQFEWNDPRGAGEDVSTERPFAGLARLKDHRQSRAD